MYLIAVLCPPLAILASGRVISSFVNGALWVLAWTAILSIAAAIIGIPLYFVCLIHAIAVISNDRANKRVDKIVRALR